MQVYEAHMLHLVEKDRARVYLNMDPSKLVVWMYTFFSVLPACTVIFLFPLFLGLSAAVIGSCYMYPHPGESPLHKLSCYAVFECRVLPLRS